MPQSCRRSYDSSAVASDGFTPLEKRTFPSTAIVTALVEKIGYEKATQVAHEAQGQRKTIRDIVLQMKLLEEKEFDQLVSPEQVMRLGSDGQDKQRHA